MRAGGALPTTDGVRCAPTPARPTAPEDTRRAGPDPGAAADRGGEALFGELTRWDTGASVRAAVIASIPLIDGPLGRRISDAILFVPEGIAVIRIAEVLRQSGVVKAVPEGAWTIAPESGPGQALQLSGGGSTPLDGLMRAGMDVAMKLRRAGLEPGRIARLTVLVGDVTGLIPGDGDLGEGDLVARLEPRSLLLGIARSSRYAGVDNPRLWTTADVRAALEALELSGRGPTVEELNGEGFPYSPYVLRRPELLTPAALGAQPSPVVTRTSAPDTDEAAPAREQPSPESIAAAVAASAAAGHAAAAEESAASAKSRDTVAIDEPAAPPDDGGGIGGLFADAEPDRHPVGTVVPPRTPRPRPRRCSSSRRRPRHRRCRRSTGARPSRPRSPPAPRAARHCWRWSGCSSSPSSAWGLAAAAGPGRRRRRRRCRRDGCRDPGRRSGRRRRPGGVGHRVSRGSGAGGRELRRARLRRHRRFLRRAGLHGTVAGPVLHAGGWSGGRRRGRTGADARHRRGPAAAGADRHEWQRQRQRPAPRGVRYPGSPAELSGAQYASAVSGPTVTIVETAWVDEDAAGAAAEIDAIADAALSLPVPPLPAG
ncbi:hypothetical protein [Blastococcus brunescens]|uniref:PASTA domain-containing protein n=1 Tax=Blastococcus brunescens TaxID=1564165 RepID=A0ABZ1B396_9ACTN|nr:hypothetical protein [Blastococcus sp. BMG 8361]WRL65280.1 hypothetical protein U6N30_06380 [Blastococcus sp. BMG 8361]